MINSAVFFFSFFELLLRLENSRLQLAVTYEYMLSMSTWTSEYDGFLMLFVVDATQWQQA